MGEEEIVYTKQPATPDVPRMPRRIGHTMPIGLGAMIALACMMDPHGMARGIDDHRPHVIPKHEKDRIEAAQRKRERKAAKKKSHG